MISDLTLLVLLTLLFVGFLISLILHKRRLRQFLETKDQKELNSPKCVMDPYLFTASIFFVLSVVCLILTLLGLRVPFTIVSKSIYLSFSGEHTYSYQSLIDLLYDVLPIVLVLIIFSTAYLLKSQERISYLFEFFAGLLMGYAFAVAYILSFIGFSIGSIVFLMIILLIFFAFKVPLANSIGLITGFVLSPLFVVTQTPFVFKYITWLAFMAALGALSGSVFLFASESNLFFPFVILFALVVPFYLVHGVAEALIFLFGISLVLVILHKLKDVINAIILIMITVALYLAAWPEYTVLVSITFIIGLASGIVYVAMQYKNSVQAILIKWVQISLKEGKGEKIDLSEHVSIPDFRRKWIPRGSFFFTYLKHLILKPLEAEGLVVEVIEKEVDNVKYVKGIFVCSSKQ